MKRRGFFARIAGAVLALVYCPTKLPGRQAPAIYTPGIWASGGSRDSFIIAINLEMKKMTLDINEYNRVALPRMLAELEAEKNSDLSPLEKGGGPCPTTASVEAPREARVSAQSCDH